MTVTAFDRMEIPLSISLNRFLAMLATDSDKLAEYLENPQRVMKESELSQDDVLAFQNGMSGASPTVVKSPVVSLVPMPTVGVSIAATCVVEGPAQVTTQPPSRRVIEPVYQIPTFTHQVVFEPIAQQPSRQKPASPESTVQEAPARSRNVQADETQTRRRLTH
jgi:hypothetical protein